MTRVIAPNSVQDLLQHLDVGDEALFARDQVIEKPLGVGLVRVLCAHKVHGDVGVEEDHRGA